MRKTLLSRTSVFTQQSGHPEQWLYKAAALLFLVAAGLQMLIGDKPASRVPLWLAAIATFGATVWLVVRRLREEATRRETEDKMVKDLQEYLTTPHTNDSHTSPEVAQAVCCQDLALETCDFQEFGPALQSEAPSGDPAAMGAISPDCFDSRRKARDIFEPVGPLPENPML